MSIENENPEIEKPNSEVNSTENQSVEEVTPEEVSENEKPESEVSPVEEQSPEEVATEEKSETETEPETEHQEIEIAEENYSNLSLKETLGEMESIVNKDDAHSFSKKFGALREQANHKISDETEDKKHEFVEQGNAEEHFEFHHPEASKLSALVNIFREEQDKFHKSQEAEHQKNLDERLSIIEKLKNLSTNSEPGTNLFKSIREVKEAWGNAGGMEEGG